MAIDMKAIHDSRRTLVMGVLNITEDSFSDGGLWLAPEAAKAHGEAMMKAGADIIDIGAESTRPGAKRVSEADEKARVLGAVDALIPEGAVLSIDTTKGNGIINVNGFAVSQTVKEGYILRYSEDVLDVMRRTTGKAPHTFGVSMQDITPYGNGVYHLNSILQPATATRAPVIGVAVTTEQMVAGCATGATHFVDVEETARFALEVAKAFGAGTCRFYDEEEFRRLQARYGRMDRLMTLGADAV